MNITRESIFVAAVRTFCTTLTAVLGILMGFVILFIVISFFSTPSFLPEKSSMMISPDADGNRELLPESSPAILRIDFHGIIGDENLNAENIEQILLDSREDMLKNGRVKGILLHMNTPGGLATEADTIYRLLLEYKKKYDVPIYAYVDGICASGGMYVTSAADRIYATPPSIVGSIGVILGPAFNFSQAMEKIGVQSLTLTEGKDKDMLNPFRPWVPGEDKSLREIMAQSYDLFVDIVTAARPHLDKKMLIQEYGAQVYISKEAEKLGYIEAADSDYKIALTDLVKAAGIKENERYQVVKLAAPRTFWSELMRSHFSYFTGKITHTFQFGPYNNPEFSGKLLYLYQPQ